MTRPVSAALAIVVALTMTPSSATAQADGQAWSKNWHADGGAHFYVHTPASCDIIVKTIRWNGSQGPLQLQWDGVQSPVPQYFGNQGASNQNGYYADAGLILTRGTRIDIQMQSSGADIYLSGSYDCD